jgi:long-chain acyl-CoA synthetase
MLVHERAEECSVRELTVPPLRVVPAEANLSDLAVDNAVRSPHRVQFRRQSEGRWEDVTCRDFLSEVTALAKGLVAAGVGPGDRVGIMSRTCYEWTLADFALWSAGAVPVPIYETSSAEQVAWILGDSGAVGCFVELDTHAAVVAGVRGSLPALANVWSFGSDLEQLVDGGRQVTDAEIEARRRTLRSDSLATLIYTSGTTGQPKGCELTHANFQSGIENVVAGLGELFVPGNSTLLFLPLAHVFARAIEIGCVIGGVTMGHTADVKDLLDDLVVFQPTFLLSVPRVFEKIYNGAQAKATAEGKGRIFDRSAAVAIAYSEALDHGGAGLALRAQHAVFDRLVYSKLRARMGGKVKYAVSGGAPLGARLGHFFRGIGITILEGYGLTETSAASTLNLPEAISIGSVGRPIPGAGVRIGDDGEVLLRGSHVFVGYWNNPEATAEAFDAEGWFRTGDIGELDAEGYLRITGRKKEIIVTAAGKNVAPAVLEDRIRAHPLVSQCMVVGDNKPYIACLVTLDAEALPAWLTAHGRPADTSVSLLVDDPALLAAVQAAVDEANLAVSKAEAVKRFVVLTVDFTEEGGQLTPTMKLRRGVVHVDFAADLERLYA